MLRSFVKSFRSLTAKAQSAHSIGISSLQNVSRGFSGIIPHNPLSSKDTGLNNQRTLCKPPLSMSVPLLGTPFILQQQSRTVTKFSLGKGKRQTVRSVTARFKRLDCGIWIRRIAGTHKHLWKKSLKRQMRLERHVTVNATRSYMLDKMVSPYWRTPKFWVNDPYEPYHVRDDFPLSKKNPRPCPPNVLFARDS